MTLEFATAAGRSVAPEADEIAAVVAVLSALEEAPAPASVLRTTSSRWRMAARNYEQHAR